MDQVNQDEWRREIISEWTIWALQRFTTFMTTKALTSFRGHLENDVVLVLFVTVSVLTCKHVVISLTSIFSFEARINSIIVFIICIWTSFRAKNLNNLLYLIIELVIHWSMRNKPNKLINIKQCTTDNYIKMF